MNGRTTAKTTPSKKYVLGTKSFAAISAVEGLKLRSESVERFERAECLSPAQRREETIRAFASAQKHG